MLNFRKWLYIQPQSTSNAIERDHLTILPLKPHDRVVGEVRRPRRATWGALSTPDHQQRALVWLILRCVFISWYLWCIERDRFLYQVELFPPVLHLLTRGAELATRDARRGV